ncbi:amidohydrolase [Arthrobacter sp. efr-133-TYG-104]|uniref:amidohydrolase n=1 Tax=Arthrobacter sp. efr-133-TYG-104 TaxID=3040324 RepID=UPI002549F040|nr:amidohydrolase [Arthrobacter sp. efr-133-TYG-104]
MTGWQEELYKDLHQHPELGNQESRTAAIASGLLQEFGYEVHSKIGSTGVVGILKHGEGPTVLVRADMDALPVAEDTGLPYASKESATDDDGGQVPVAHACGHDVHVACLLGAARLMAERPSGWSGTFIALFQPAEELANGARKMLDGGLAALIPKPDVAMAQHVLAFPSGHLGTRPGAFLSSADSMRITVYGRGSHGSMPQLSIDPVVLAASIVLRLQTVVSREVAPGEFAVLTIGRMSAGTKSNIISDRAVLELNIRTFDDRTRTLLLDAIRRIVVGECSAAGSPKDPEFELYDHYPLTQNDPEVTARVDAAFRNHFGERASTLDRQPASEDFSELPDSFGIPYTYWGLGGTDHTLYAKAEAAGAVSSEIPANHSPHFAPVISPTLETGTAAVVVAALAWLGRPASSR